MPSRFEEIHCPGCNQSFRQHVNYAYSTSDSSVNPKAYWSDEPLAPVILEFTPIDLELYCPRCGMLEYEPAYMVGDQYPTLVVTGIKAGRRQ